jgi:hypothetical protein
MHLVGTSLLLNDAGGQISGPSTSAAILAVAISRTLVGSLTISGIANSDGSVYGAWTLPPGTTAGSYYAPGSAASGGAALWYALSNNAADAGAAVVAFHHK